MRKWINGRINNVFILTLILLVYIVQFCIIKDQRLDGDVPNLLVNEYQQEVERQTFGIQNIFSEKKYANSNRYLSFMSLKLLFAGFAPCYQVIKSWISRTEFIYSYIAIFKLAIQFLLAFCIGYLVQVKKGFLLIHILFFSILSQHFGFYEQFGIIDHSITYVAFYGMTMLGHISLLLYLKYRAAYFIWFDFFIFNMLSWMTVFSGSLNYALHLVSLPFLFYYYKDKMNYKLRATLATSGCIGILSYLVSLQNIENIDSIFIYIRYILAAKGLVKILTMHLGWFLLLGFVFFQYYILKRTANKESNQTMVRIVLIFSIAYLMLIPLGGYRPYRPFVIRYDVIIPISLSVIALTLYFHQFIFHNDKYKMVASIFLLCLFFFQFYKIKTPNNQDEKAILHQIETTKDRTIYIHSNSEFLSWDKIGKWQEKDVNNMLILLEFIDKEKKIVIR